MRYYLLLVGVLMAVFTFTAPVSGILVPHWGLTPDNIASAAPAGAGNSTTAGERDYDVTAAAATGNTRTLTGAPGASVRVGGNPAAAVDHVITVSVPGIPDRTAGYTLSPDDGTTTYGGDPSHVLREVNTVRAVIGTSYVHPHVTATRDGMVHAVFRNSTAGIRYARWDPDVHVWLQVVVTAWGTPAVTPGTGNYDIHPVIWAVPADNTVGYVLYAGGWYATDSDTQVFRVAYSVDGGDGWAGAYDSDLSVTFSAASLWSQGRAVWDACGQQVVITYLNTTTGPVYTSRLYVANAPSGSEILTVSAGALTGTASHALTYDHGTTYLAAVQTDNTINTYGRSADVNGWVLLKDGIGASAALLAPVMVVNTSGELLLLYRSSVDGDEIMMLTSPDGGRTWGNPTAYPYTTAGGAECVLDDDASGGTTLSDGILMGSAAWGTETLYVVGSLVTSATTVDDSIISLHFGGVSSITSDAVPAGTDTPYYPTSIPATKSGLYQAFVGASVQSITADSDGDLVYRVSTAAAQGFDDYRPVGDPTVVGADWSIGPDSSGGDTGTIDFAMILYTHDDAVANNYVVSARIDWDNGQIQIYDQIVGANVGTAVAFDNTAWIIIRGALDGESGLCSFWYRGIDDLNWTAIVTAQAVTSTGGGLTTTILFGKVSSSTAGVDTRFFIPFGSGSTGWLADLAANNFPTAIYQLRATGDQQRLPWGYSLWWQGAPLHPGDTSTVTTTSRRPLSAISAWSAVPSPTRYYRSSAGSAGATRRVVWDLGSTYEARLSAGLSAIVWQNAKQLAAVRLMRWTGAAWSTVFEGSTYWRPFGADGAVGFTRASAASCLFRPNAANGTPLVMAPGDVDGWWARISDGVNSIGAYVKTTHPGHFSTTTGVAAGAIEIDPATIVTEAGAFGSLATSTTTGNMVLCRPGGCVIGGESIDASRYIALEFDAVPGVTAVDVGLLTAGAWYPLAEPVRDGASLRLIAPDELRITKARMPQSRRTTRVGRREVELPYDTILTQPGSLEGGAAVNALSWDGSTARVPTGSNHRYIMGAHSIVGQQVPIALVVDAFMTGDPASTPQVVGPEQVIWGYMEAQIDDVISRGLLFGRTQAHQHGSRLVVREVV